MEAAAQAVNEARIYHFFLKPWDAANLLEIVKNGLRHYEVALENRMLNERVREQNHQIKEQNEKLIELDRIKINMTNMIIHDLKGPLAGIVSGPLFRARLNSRSEKLGNRQIGLTAMYELIRSYLRRLPRSMKTVELEDGTRVKRCIYSPHSLRATTATLLLKSSVDILEVQELLGHKNVTTTQIYDKRVRQTRDSASHKIPF